MLAENAQREPPSTMTISREFTQNLAHFGSFWTRTARATAYESRPVLDAWETQTGALKLENPDPDARRDVEEGGMVFRDVQTQWLRANQGAWVNVERWR